MMSDDTMVAILQTFIVIHAVVNILKRQSERTERTVEYSRIIAVIIIMTNVQVVVMIYYTLKR